MRKKYISRLLLALPVLLAACYPQGPDYIDDLDVVYTNHNPNYVFKGKSTYAMPDKIVKITGNAITGDPPKYLSDAVATPILTQIATNMTAMGYTQVDIDSDPDLLLAPSELETTTITYWYDYWGWWWGGYYPGWGYPYYPYYPYGGYTTSYTTGTLMMMIIDPNQTSGSGNPLSQWVGAANGVLTYSYSASRVNKLIDQAFRQSPYLKSK